jgi:AcrR family transcriptional regulator
MKPSTSDSYHHGDLRRALLDAATVLLDRDGIEALTLRSCAREAGVSHAAPAHHIKDLRGLRTALAARFWQDFGAALEQTLEQSTGDSTSRLQRLCSTYVAYAVNHPNRYLMMFRCNDLDNSSPELQAGYHRAKAPLLDCVSALTKAPPDPSELLLIWSTVHGLADLLVSGSAGPASGGPGATTPPAMVLERLIQGILCRNERQKPA